MKTIRLILVFCSLLFVINIIAQPLPYKENSKWGIKEDNAVIIKPVYDTLFNYNGSGKVCLACYKAMVPSSNKFIKTLTKIYACNYIDREDKRLVVKTEGNDTCSVFTLGKHTLKQFSENPTYFIVSVKSKKHLVDNNFRQLTFKGYHDLRFTAEPDFIIAQKIGEGNLISEGLINLKEEIIIGFQYSEIKINPYDSLIVCCSAGVRANAEDDIFNYDGKKVGSYRKHVTMATKNFVIHKIFEPKEHYIIYNIETKEERILNVDEANYYQFDEILVRVKNDWFIYNMRTNEKRLYKGS